MELKMTYYEFLIECGNYDISPDIALENDNVVAAVKAKDIDKLRDILLNEF